jgi:hypothetical protein
MVGSSDGVLRADSEDAPTGTGQGQGCSDRPIDVGQEVVPVARTSGTVKVSSAFPYEHEDYHGFCTVCGSVWPCARGTALLSISSPRFVGPVPRGLQL